ncbi:hypothetical protein [Cellulosimicrobium sp. TH-20]|nr:hypothetical protein [Cellulosimicrobium sp. TH-20]
MRAPVEAVPEEPADLHEAEEVCGRCHLVKWRGAVECERGECPA